MSAVIRTRRRSGKSRQLPASTPMLWLVLGLAILFFLVQYGQQLLQAHQLSEQAAEQRVANAQIRDQNARLKATLDYVQSDKYIEQRAREDLNLRRPDEQVLIPIAATPSGATSQVVPLQGPAAPAPAAPTNPQAAPNWQKWLDLFATSPSP